MDKFYELKNHLNVNIVPQCAEACRDASTTEKAAAARELVRVRDLVEKEVLTPLLALGPTSASRMERRVFELSTRGLITHLDNKLTSVLLGPRVHEDVELGLRTMDEDQNASVSQWTKLDETLPEEPKTPKFPGAWPNSP